MSGWICDGIPKDGENYPELGGAHEPYENYSLDCDICGLPKGSEKSSRKIGLPKILSKPILGVLTVGIILLVLGSAAYFTYFNSLMGGKRHLSSYEEAVASGEEALAIVRAHRSPEELEQAQKHLELAINKLSKIPPKAAIYSEAEVKMNSYDSLSLQITNKISNFELCAVEPKPDYCLF